MSGVKVVADLQLGDITFLRKKGLKRMTLYVRRDGSVRVAMPSTYRWNEGIKFVESKRKWIIAAQQRMRTREQSCPPLNTEQEHTLRLTAQMLFPPMVASLAQLYGFQFGKVSVRKSRTRWGSCSHKNDISLSIYLAALPEHLQRFVVLHELCHTRIKDHSIQFHALLNSLVDGKEKELVRELRQHKTVS